MARGTTTARLGIALVAAGLAAVVTPGQTTAGPPGPTSVNPVPECVRPVGGGAYNVIFGWEIRGGQPDGSVNVPVGPDNNLNNGNGIVAGPPTSFDKPVTNAQDELAHVVWPPFFWDPTADPPRERDGRTQYWPVNAAAVQINAGNATWKLTDTDQEQLGISTNAQRCSQHVFIDKTWDGEPTPPDELDKQVYEIQIRQTSNPTEPDVVNAQTTTCKYLEYEEASVFFAPYGEGFTDVESDVLNCYYQNEFGFSTDIGGYWVPVDGVYEVSETGLPDGWENVAGLGEFTVNWENPGNYSECSYYPAFGTDAAVPDSDGTPIPEFGRASPKWCLHTVDNRRIPPPTTTTTTTTT
ncbi:MAG: hypothetical protein AAGA42_21905, partial [Actinomycetota bacterium]